YLNDLYRGRAEKAGITYIDVWDGFVDESNNYNNYGPDVEGQTRRLRSGDGAHFTRAGARKLAHYVEREIRRVMMANVPVATPLPQEPEPDTKAPAAVAAAPKQSAPRPRREPQQQTTNNSWGWFGRQQPYESRPQQRGFFGGWFGGGRW